MHRYALLGAASAALTAVAGAAHAQSLEYAFQGELSTLDPYTLNETFTLGTLGNVYEGLVQRGPDLEIEPALATEWEQVEPTRWRFHLREGVTFHNGNEFTAEDVVFSADRLRSQASDLQTYMADSVQVKAVDAHTVDFILEDPNPILNSDWSFWYIMDKEWAEANDAVQVSSASAENPNYAALNANGTGPYRITSHETGVRTEFEANDDWWGAEDKPGNVEQVTYQPIGSAPTRVAALLSGELDMAYPIPVQDIQRVEQAEGVRALTGPELRTIFLGFNIMDDELASSDLTGENPFKSRKVRKAVYQAINIEAIRERIMRGTSTPAALLISPLLFERTDQFERYPYDPEAAQSLMEEAGYGDGFSVTMDCPNNRYVNDEEICQAVVSMMANIGIEVNLNAQPKAQYFSKVLQSGGYDTDFYLLGWTPSSLDSWNVLNSLIHCRTETSSEGSFNLGGYCNEKVDELAARVQTETDIEERNRLIAEAFRLHKQDVGHIPLHQQGLAWGVAEGVEVVQRADNVFMFEYATVEE